jgi:4-amino-4-deoxy-L-arabinose transferase-like glycosyltransferase
MGSDEIRGDIPAPVRGSSPDHRILLYLLGLVLVTAALLRFPLPGSVPPGLWFDEALNGQDACAVWGLNSIGSGQGPGFRLIYTNVFPREPIFESLLALSVGICGPTVEALRIVPAGIGLFTVLLLFLMLRSETGTGTALTAAAILATMRWHVIFSRLVFRTIILGPWLIGIVWIALSYQRKPGLLKAALLGLMVGGGFYTYLAWYLLLPLVAGMITWLILQARKTPGAYPGIALMIICMLISAAPIGIHYLMHPESLMARPGEVSVFKPNPNGSAGSGFPEILENAGEALLMFHWKGDHVAKQNIPHAPALDRTHGIFMLIGLWICLLRLTGRQHDWNPLPSRVLPAIIFGWLGCGMLATIFARTDSPNFLRTLCLTPAVAATCAVGLMASIRFLSGFWNRKVIMALAILLVMASGINCYHQVFNRWAGREDVLKGFNGDITQLGYYSAGKDNASYAVMVPRSLYEHRTFQFLSLGRTHVHPYHDWQTMLGHMGESPPGGRIIITTANNRVYQPLRNLLPAGKVDQAFEAPGGNTWALAFAIHEDDLPAADILEELDRKWQPPMHF